MIDTATLNEEELLLFIELRRLAQRASAASRDCLLRSPQRPQATRPGELHDRSDDVTRQR